MFLSIGTARNLIIFSCPNTYVYYGSSFLNKLPTISDVSIFYAIISKVAKVPLARSAQQTKMYTSANNVDPDETTGNEPFHQDLHYLSFIFLF